jgi:hypothetical protein
VPAFEDCLGDAVVLTSLPLLGLGFTKASSCAGRTGDGEAYLGLGRLRVQSTGLHMSAAGAPPAPRALPLAWLSRRELLEELAGDDAAFEDCLDDAVVLTSLPLLGHGFTKTSSGIRTSRSTAMSAAAIATLPSSIWVPALVRSATAAIRGPGSGCGQ